VCSAGQAAPAAQSKLLKEQRRAVLLRGDKLNREPLGVYSQNALEWQDSWKQSQFVNRKEVDVNNKHINFSWYRIMDFTHDYCHNPTYKAKYLGHYKEFCVSTGKQTDYTNCCV
jgi:hypothetical protein